MFYIQIPDSLRREVQKRLDLMSSGKVSIAVYTVHIIGILLIPKIVSLH